MKKLSILAALILVSSVAGCATFQEEQKPSEASLQSRTAIALDVDASKIKIFDIRSTDEQTLYEAKTPRGVYDCSVTSGTSAALGMMGTMLPDSNCKKR